MQVSCTGSTPFAVDHPKRESARNWRSSALQAVNMFDKAHSDQMELAERKRVVEADKAKIQQVRSLSCISERKARTEHNTMTPNVIQVPQLAVESCDSWLQWVLHAAAEAFVAFQTNVTAHARLMFSSSEIRHLKL